MMSSFEQIMKMPLDGIEKEIERIENILDEIWANDEGGNWEGYCAKCQPYWDEILPYYQAKRLKKIPKMIGPIPEYGDKMSIEYFKACCEVGGFTNNDGTGYYATDTEESDIEFSCKDFTMNRYRKDFPYVVWYNK